MAQDISDEQDDLLKKQSENDEPPLLKEGELSPLLDLQPRRSQSKNFFIIFIICIGIVCHWLMSSELFDIPEEVQQTRLEFAKAKEKYILRAPYWDAKLRHFKDIALEELALGEQAFLDLVQEAPGELFVSFLLRNLHLSLDRLEETTAFPRQGSTFSVVVSKPEAGIWPLKIMLSIEIEIKYSAEKFSLAISRLRRGSQDIALNLAWAYFGPELETLRAFESHTRQVILVTTKE